MTATLSSRQRLLAALACQPTDHVPCCFSAFKILEDRCTDQAEYLQRQLDLGLDVIARINVLSPVFDPRVTIREWRVEQPGSRYPILHKEYQTPAGVLRTSVEQSEDWPWGDHIPFLDDFLIPRSTKFLITGPGSSGDGDSLEALSYLLASPTDDEIAEFRTRAQRTVHLARRHDLLTMAAYGMVAEMAAWLVGISELMMLTADAPDLLENLLAIIESWHRERMALTLEKGIDLFVRRAWYENADFWSPPLFRRFVLPSLRRDVEMAHAAGAKFGYLMSCASMPLLDLMMEAGVDVLLGIDPAQDHTMDLAKLKQRTAGKMCLWGGVCGYLTIETGTPDNVVCEVRQAISTLAPGGGFILAPVTNVRADTPRAWANVDAMIEAWKVLRTPSAARTAESS